MKALVLSKMARPSSTALTMVLKLSSARTIPTARSKMLEKGDVREASRATEVPEPMAMPMSAALRAGASLTPSPVCTA